MDAGTAFLAVDPHSKREHLWVVLSDPKRDPERVLIANITSLDEFKERACTTLAKLFEGKDTGLLTVVEAVHPLLLKRMRDGVMESCRITMEKAEILIEQGLVSP